MLNRFELYIDQNNSGNLIEPAVVDGVRWKTYRTGAPSKLTFSVMADEAAKFAEGNAVSMLVNGEPLFFGFVFRKKRDKNKIIQVTAYDQLRYLSVCLTG